MSIHLLWKSIVSVDTTSPASQALSLLAAQGKVIESIGPGSVGRVQLQGVSWLARCADTLLHPLPVNTSVQIVDRVGVTLLVRPLATPVSAANDTSSACQIMPFISRETAVA